MAHTAGTFKQWERTGWPCTRHRGRLALTRAVSAEEARLQGTLAEPPGPWRWDPMCVHFMYLSINRFSNREAKPKAPKAGLLRWRSGQKGCCTSVLSGPCTCRTDRQLRNYRLARGNDRLRAYRIILLAGDRKKMKVKCNLGKHCLGCLSRPGPE